MLTMIVLLLLLSLISVGCGAGEESEPRVASSPTASDSVTVSENAAPTTEDERYFNLDTLGGRHTILGESSADLGLGFRSRLIMLNDGRAVFSERQRENMHRILIETVPDRFEMFSLLSVPITEGVLPLVLDAHGRIIAELIPTLGEWNGYFFVADYNGNGVDEFVVLGIGGSQYAPVISEYGSGKLNVVLDPFTDVGLTVVVQMLEPGVVVIYDFSPNRQEAPYRRLVFEWSEQTGLYERTSSTSVESFPE